MKKNRFITLWLLVCLICTSCGVPKDSAVVLCLAKTKDRASMENSGRKDMESAKNLDLYSSCQWNTQEELIEDNVLWEEIFDFSHLDMHIPSTDKASAVQLLAVQAESALADPVLHYQTTESYDIQTGIRRTTLDTQGYDLSVYYEIPIFEESTPGYQEINKFFDALCEGFFSPKNKNLQAVWEYITAPEVSGTPYYYEWSVRMNDHTDKLVSVSISYNWYMGGVADYGSDSYTFDVNTGKLLCISELSNKTEEELKGMIISAMTEIDQSTGAIEMDRVRQYSLDDFEFYVQDGQIWINFDKYEISDGAAGGFQIMLLPAVKTDRKPV
ncbi:hypothetical protein AALB16_00440 [Lachnospiraceae bacterium 62-35]